MQMRPIVASVCRSVTLVSHAKTAEPIELPFELRTRLDRRNHALDEDPDLPWEATVCRGKGGSL